MAERKAEGNYRPKSVAIDLDGTLAQYDGWKGIENIGDPIEGAHGFLQALKDDGCYIIVHTARTCEANNANSRAADVVEAWLDRNGLYHDEIWTGPGKPIACAYVDDRAVECKPGKSPLAAYSYAMVRVRELIKGEK